MTGRLNSETTHDRDIVTTGNYNRIAYDLSYCTIFDDYVTFKVIRLLYSSLFRWPHLAESVT